MTHHAAAQIIEFHAFLSFDAVPGGLGKNLQAVRHSSSAGPHPRRQTARLASNLHTNRAIRPSVWKKGRDMTHYVETVIAFARTHEEWALAIAFLVAAAESIVVVSWFVPSMAIFVVLASLGGVADQSILALWLAAGLGAAAGDWVSFGLGYRYGEPVKRSWPFSRYPDWVDRGQRFFDRWGILSIFIGRFVGPARSFVLLIAGITRMPLVVFSLASLGSALVWAGVVIGPASAGAKWLWGS
jgi:membrane protein DedA with SNARE-associated domain